MSKPIAPPDEPTLHWVRLGQAEHKPPNWVVPDLLMAGMTVVGGPPKSGKSTFTYGMIATVVGLPCVAYPPWMRNVRNRGPVCVLSAEASASVIRYDIEKQLRCPVPDDVEVHVSEDPWDFQLDGVPDAEGLTQGQRKLLEWLEWYRPALTVLDPWRDYTDADENDAGQVVRTLRPIRDWHEKNDAAMLLVHHTTKKPHDARTTRNTPQDLRGSGALFGKADGVLMFTPRGDQGDPNPVEIAATFKRGAPWVRLVQPATHDFKGEASEVLLKMDEDVLMALDVGVPSFEALLTATKLTKNLLEESLAKLRRNGWVKKVEGIPVLAKPLVKKGTKR